MAKCLSVAMLTDSYFPNLGGGPVHVRELKQRLEKQYGYKVDLFYPHAVNLMYRTLWSLFIPWKILVLSLINSYDLIHSHGYNSGFSGKIASLLLGKPVLHTVHGANLLDQRKSGLKYHLEKFLLTQIKYNAQITVSSSFLNYENVNKKLFVIANGVDVAAFDSVHEKKNIEPTLIWVGRRDPVKGLKYLEKAVKILMKRYPNLITYLITGGKVQGSEIIAQYKKSHLFVLPSLSEGQPLTLLEAWAAKLPVVVTTVGDNTRMVEDKVNGLLVQPKDVVALVDKIDWLLTHPDQATQMGKKGYQLVAKQYTWDIMVERIVKIYDLVLKGK